MLFVLVFIKCMELISGGLDSALLVSLACFDFFTLSFVEYFD